MSYPDLSKVVDPQVFPLTYDNVKFKVTAVRTQQGGRPYVNVQIAGQCVVMNMFEDYALLDDFLLTAHKQNSLKSCPGYRQIKKQNKSYALWLLEFIKQLNIASNMKFCYLKDEMVPLEPHQELSDDKLSPYLWLKRGYSMYEAAGYMPVKDCIFNSASMVSLKKCLDQHVENANFEMSQRVHAIHSKTAFSKLTQTLTKINSRRNKNRKRIKFIDRKIAKLTRKMHDIEKGIQGKSERGEARLKVFEFVGSVSIQQDMDDLEGEDLLFVKEDDFTATNGVFETMGSSASDSKFVDESVVNMRFKARSQDTFNSDAEQSYEESGAESSDDSKSDSVGVGRESGHSVPMPTYFAFNRTPSTVELSQVYQNMTSLGKVEGESESEDEDDDDGKEYKENNSFFAIGVEDESFYETREMVGYWRSVAELLQEKQSLKAKVANAAYAKNILFFIEHYDLNTFSDAAQRIWECLQTKCYTQHERPEQTQKILRALVRFYSMLLEKVPFKHCYFTQIYETKLGSSNSVDDDTINVNVELDINNNNNDDNDDDDAPDEDGGVRQIVEHKEQLGTPPHDIRFVVHTSKRKQSRHKKRSATGPSNNSGNKQRYKRGKNTRGIRRGIRRGRYDQIEAGKISVVATAPVNDMDVITTLLNMHYITQTRVSWRLVRVSGSKYSILNAQQEPKELPPFLGTFDSPTEAFEEISGTRSIKILAFAQQENYARLAQAGSVVFKLGNVHDANAFSADVDSLHDDDARPKTILEMKQIIPIFEEIALHFKAFQKLGETVVIPILGWFVAMIDHPMKGNKAFCVGFVIERAICSVVTRSKSGIQKTANNMDANTLQRARLFLKRSAKWLHEIGILHNALHLGHVLVRANGDFALTDFGRAQLIDDQTNPHAVREEEESFEFFE